MDAESGDLSYFWTEPQLMVVVFDFRLPKFATLLVSVKTNKLKSYIFTSWIKDMNINSLFSQLKRFNYTSNLKRVFFLHMSCKICCPRGCIVTPIAFVWHLSTVCCQMSPQIRIQSHINCIWLAFLHCVLSNVSSNCRPMHSHIASLPFVLCCA